MRPPEKRGAGVSGEGFAVLAAALYALSTPLAKQLLNNISSTLLAALLYLGAGLGVALTEFIRSRLHYAAGGDALKRTDAPFVATMILLDIAAPILLFLGLSKTSAENVSLLNNFEIVATSMIAWLLFSEAVPARLWLAITLITLGSILLSVGDFRHLSYSPGSLFALLACLCWGFENNCTRVLSRKDPLKIVIIKGLGSGSGALVIAVACDQASADIKSILCALLLGFLSYGLSIVCYIRAQREIGAARTSAYYALSPLIGATLSLIIFLHRPSPSFIAAFALMSAGAYLASSSRGVKYNKKTERGA